MTEPPYLTDNEVRDICAGIEQPAAMIRYLRSVVRVPIVLRKPNGMPLVGRDALRQALGGTATGAPQAPQRPNTARLRALTGGRV
ncbi:MAG: hypothetical protein AB7K86_08400 [Rhodospirillales bacterium]